MKYPASFENRFLFPAAFWGVRIGATKNPVEFAAPPGLRETPAFRRLLHRCWTHGLLAAEGAGESCAEAPAEPASAPETFSAD